jgi:hypothetical protein
MSAIPLDISIVPDLSVIKWFGRNQDPTTFTITNNDTRAITDCKLYVTRGDFLPKGAGRAEEAIFMKRAIGEDLVSQGWLEGKVDDGAWANITEISPLLIGALEPEESREFHIRLVVPDTVTNEGKTSFAVMIAAIAAGVALPTLSIALDDADKDEGNSGNTSFTFIVTRAGSLTGESSATWTVSGMGTNPADADDFGGTFPTGTVTFATGEATQIITIDVSGDTDVEEDETFVVTLSDAVGATISVGGVIGTIRNEDVPSPVPLENLVAWYDASDPANFVLSGSTILQALDKSGNNNHATQFGSYALPTLSGGAMNFSGTQMLQTPAAVAPMNNPCTIYMVVNSTSIAPKGTIYCGCTGGGSDGNYVVLARYGGSYVSMDVFWRNIVATVDPPNVGYGVTHRIVHRTNGTTDFSIYVDGSLKITETVGSMATSVNQFFVIGSWMSSPIATPTNYFVGYIKEMLVYHANHTPEQIAEVNDYLGSKYP